MNEAEYILSQYEIRVREIQFLRHNENKVYAVLADEGKFILRIHENLTGMQADELIKAGNKRQLVTKEMEILDYLQNRGMSYVQKPMKNKQGEYIAFSKDGNMATLLTFIEGQAINQSDIIEEVDYDAILEAVGRCLAILHRKMKNVDVTMHLDYGKPCAERLMTELLKAVEKKHISETNCQIMKETLVTLMDELEKQKEQLQLVHGDLSKSNLLYNSKRKEIVPIDFSLNGICAREYDLASMALHFEKNKEADKVLEAYSRTFGEEPNWVLMQLCMAYQIIIFIAARHEVVYEQGWFAEATDYWCGEFMEKTLKGEKFSEKIGLYQE